MDRRRPCLLPGLLLAAALLATGSLAPAPLAGQDPALEREIRESRQRLEEVRQERARLREQTTRLRTQVHDLASELGNLERQVAASATILEELDFQLEAVETQIELTTADLSWTQEELAETRETLQLRLREIYKRGPLHAAEVLLSAASFSDLLNRYKYLYLIAQRDRALVSEVAALERELVARERALRQNHTRVTVLRDERLQEHADLAAIEEERRRALGSLQDRERTVTERIRRLEEDEGRMAGLIETLERRRLESERAAPTTPAREGAAPRATAPPTITSQHRGVLPWPVRGRVLYRFGREVRPGGTVVRWNGIGIGAAGGEPVRAVGGGTVAHAGSFEGYGPTVILDHGGGFYTLYLYLGELRVREGEAVPGGAALGTVGAPRAGEAPRIEFQIRAPPGSQAVDPLDWLASG